LGDIFSLTRAAGHGSHLLPHLVHSLAAPFGDAAGRGGATADQDPYRTRHGDSADQACCRNCFCRHSLLPPLKIQVSLLVCEGGERKIQKTVVFFDEIA
jgi:hypothetical protein